RRRADRRDRGARTRAVPGFARHLSSDDRRRHGGRRDHRGSDDDCTGLYRATRDAVAQVMSRAAAGAAGAGARMSPGRARALSFRRWLALSAAGFVAFFALWWLTAASGFVSAQFLPTPLAVLKQFVTLTQSPFVGYTLQQHLASSFGRFALGFGLAVAIGIPLGLLMGWYRGLDEIVTPLFDALRFVAPIAWVPFAALWFGTGIGGPVLVIFTGAF